MSIKHKIKMNTNIQYILEKLIFSGNILTFDLEKFFDSKYNKLFITGFSGSGKTTLANNIGIAMGIKVIHYDELEEDLCVDLNKNKIEDKLKYNTKVLNYFKTLLNKKEPCVIEGIQLYELLFFATKYNKTLQLLNLIKVYPFIINNVSVLKSIYRASRRAKEYKQKFSYKEYYDWLKNDDELIKQFIFQLELFKEKVEFENELDLTKYILSNYEKKPN